MVTLIGGVAVLKLREYMRRDDRWGPGQDATLLDQLEAMRRDGKIGDGEYESLRRQLSQHVRSRLNRPGAGSAPPGNTPKVPGMNRSEIGRHAPPGYDLTGEKLPGRSEE